MRALAVLVLVALVASGCAEPLGDNGGDASTSSSASASFRTTTASVTPPTTTTTTVPASTLPTTTVPSYPAEPWNEAWVGLGFRAGVDIGMGNGEFGRLDEWTTDPWALPNVGNMEVQLMIDNEPIGLWPWHRGSSDPQRVYATDLIVVGTEPNPYAPGEFEMFEEGVEPIPPDPAAMHLLGVWAIRQVEMGSYLVTDVLPLERSGENMGYSALLSIPEMFGLCTVDPSLQHNVYAYFDHPEPEMEVAYPATVGYMVSPNGDLTVIDPSLVSCILSIDPDIRGY